MSTINKQWLLASRPKAQATVDNFRLVETALPALQDGQVLVRHHFLSLDPYMRMRMNDAKSYAAPQPLDAVMIGGTAGEVAESRHPKFAVGDKVVGMGGWQQYSVVDASLPGALRKVETTHVPLSAYLGAVGMPGVTAWYGLVKLCTPKAGETIVVSRGCRAVGIAGGADKCRYVVEELGFDACIDYKQHPDAASLDAALAQAAPKGIDGNFENVGGVILDAILRRMNPFGRMALCGMISGYDGTPIPLSDPSLILKSRLRLEGFIVSEHMEIWPEALKELGTLVATGKLKYRETIAPRIEDAPEALLGLLKGKNFGKQLVKLN
jgi:NADPH-dependent curcumin reductase